MRLQFLGAQPFNPRPLPDAWSESTEFVVELIVVNLKCRQEVHHFHGRDESRVRVSGVQEVTYDFALTSCLFLLDRQDPVPRRWRRFPFVLIAQLSVKACRSIFVKLLKEFVKPIKCGGPVLLSKCL